MRTAARRGASSARISPSAPIPSLVVVALATALVSSGLTWTVLSSDRARLPERPSTSTSAPDLAACLDALRAELEHVSTDIDDLRTHGWGEWSE